MKRNFLKSGTFCPLSFFQFNVCSTFAPRTAADTLTDSVNLHGAYKETQLCHSPITLMALTWKISQRRHERNEIRRRRYTKRKFENPKMSESDEEVSISVSTAVASPASTRYREAENQARVVRPTRRGEQQARGRKLFEGECLYTADVMFSIHFFGGVFFNLYTLLPFFISIRCLKSTRLVPLQMCSFRVFLYC